MKELKTIEETAYRILQEDSDPAVHFRLLRDVLKVHHLTLTHSSMLGERCHRADGFWNSKMNREKMEAGENFTLQRKEKEKL